VSSSPTLAQPAYTFQYLQLLLERAINLAPSYFYQPTGYQVNVISSGTTVDQTTNVKIDSYFDQFQNGNEVTTITFVATFSNTNSYQFNEVTFYTQRNGGNVIEVADFVFTSAVSKPSGYVLVLSISFNISTPLQYINPIQDILNYCQSQCSNVNCGAVASGTARYFIPFSVLNFVFIYSLGITIDYLQSLPNVQQYAQQYNNCMSNCQNICSSAQSSQNCAPCINGCMQYLSSNPIAIYIVANNITSLDQLGGIGSGYASAINICSGVVITESVNPINFVVNYYNSQGQQGAQLAFSFTISNASSTYNAIAFILSASNNSFYYFGVLEFQGTPSLSSTTFTFYITLIQT